MAFSRCLACMEKLSPGTSVCPSCGSPVPCPPNSPDSLPPGFVLEKYIIGREISRGGSSITYRAFDRQLETVRCIKEFYPLFSRRRRDMSVYPMPGEEPRFQRELAHFQREAQLLSALSDRHVARIADVCDKLDMNGSSYVVMEYLDGSTLDTYIRSLKHGLPWESARDIMVSVMDTVSSIHQQGILHRDISLNNIFLLRDGSVRLIDFGSAETMDTAQRFSEAAWPSSKKFYSPPEQVLCRSQGPGTDVYAAGVCMFKLVAGGFPHDWKAGMPLPSLRSLGFSVPPLYDQVISRATQPEREKRYATAAEMLRALKAIAFPPPAPPPKAPPQPHTYKTILWIIVLLSFVSIFLIWRGLQGSSVPDGGQSLSQQSESVSREPDASVAFTMETPAPSNGLKNHLIPGLTDAFPADFPDLKPAEPPQLGREEY